MTASAMLLIQLQGALIGLLIGLIIGQAISRRKKK